LAAWAIWARKGWIAGEWRRQPVQKFFRNPRSSGLNRKRGAAAKGAMQNGKLTATNAES
jgi:hypothetical protein